MKKSIVMLLAVFALTGCYKNAGHGYGHSADHNGKEHSATMKNKKPEKAVWQHNKNVVKNEATSAAAVGAAAKDLGLK